MNFDLVAYAGDFVSFLLQELGSDAQLVRQILLFGSASRGEAGKESDVDLFIDVNKLAIEPRIQDIRDRFNESAKVKTYWDLLGIKNEINCTIGRLEDWGDLNRSLIADGIVLYGKYSGAPDLVPFCLFVVTPSSNRNKNLSVWRSLYGYRQKVGAKVYEHNGLIVERGGQKLARGVFQVPALAVSDVSALLRKNKFQFKIFPIWQESTLDNPR